MPEEILVRLKNLYQTLARRNLRITAELLQVLALLESHGMVAVPFKGPVLAQVAYGDLTLRQFVDLDLLVSRQDVMGVKDLLLSADYHLSHAFTEKQAEVHLRRTCEFSFQHPQRTMLDVHWRFAADYLAGGPDPEEALRRRITVSLAGKTVHSLAPEDLLLVLCLHGSYHLWPTLGMISDVARLVKAQEPWDWSGLLARAAAAGRCRMLLLGLSLAAEILGAPVPPEVAAQAEGDSAVPALKRRVLAHLFAGNGAESGFLEMSRFQIKTLDRPRDRLAYLWIRAAVPTVEDWKWVRLPDSCYWLYFLLRPLRLAAHGLLRPLLRR